MDCVLHNAVSSDTHGRIDNDGSNFYQSQGLQQFSRPGSAGAAYTVASNMPQDHGYSPVGSMQQHTAGDATHVIDHQNSGQPVLNDEVNAVANDTMGASNWGQQPPYASYDSLLQAGTRSNQGGYGRQPHSRRVSGSNLYSSAGTATGQQIYYSIAADSQHAAYAVDQPPVYNQYPGTDTGLPIQHHVQPAGHLDYSAMQPNMQSQEASQQGFGYDGMTDITL
jgi:hypothetical protein